MGLQQRHIETNETIRHYFLCNYIAKSKGVDKLSKSLLGFKSGLYPHKQAWIDCSIAELKEQLLLQGALILRALGSDEQSISANQKPLDELGERLATVVDGTYAPALLTKSKVVPRMKGLSRTAREQELNGVYVFQTTEETYSEILVLDDILTTGTTLTSIIKAIRVALPSTPITLFTLAFTDYHEHPNADVTLIGNAYAWEKDNGWTVAAEYPELYTPSIDSLKRQILSDSFQ